MDQPDPVSTQFRPCVFAGERVLYSRIRVDYVDSVAFEPAGAATQGAGKEGQLTPESARQKYARERGIFESDDIAWFAARYQAG